MAVLRYVTGYATCTVSAAVLWVTVSQPGYSNQIDLPYQTPSQDVIDIVDAAPSPGSVLAPGGRYLLVQDYPALPSIEDMAAAEYRLAGMRINPANNSISKTPYIDALRIVAIDSDDAVDSTIDVTGLPVTGLPDNARILSSVWAPDGSQLAVLNAESDAVRLYRIDAVSGEASQWSDVAVNTVWGANLQWSNDSNSVYVLAVDPERGSEPAAAVAPSGPVITESRGRTAPARTYQDLLQNSHDEALFDFYFSSYVTSVTIDGEVTYLGESGVYNNFSLSPDNNYLLVTTITPPYSYSVPHFRFARNTEVWSIDGEHHTTVSELALADNLPISFDAVVAERRNINWRTDADATLVFAEAADGGDPAVDTEVRDHVYQWHAPFKDAPEFLLGLQSRFSGLRAADENNALVYERWWRSREERVWHINPASPGNADMLWERSWQDRYNDPGSPLMTRNEQGRRVVYLDNGHLLLLGDGASDEGDRPFIDRYELASGSTDRLWRSQAPYYEQPRALLNASTLTFLTQRESVNEPADFYLRSLNNDTLLALTSTPHPMPHTLGISRELIHYEREDGLPMSATLFLPAGYDKDRDGPLPTVIWAYPREYRSTADAAQVSGSPYEFNRISYWRPQFLATQGYAVFDNATMPIVGEGDAEPNDTFIQQLVMNSEAVIQAGVERGVTDASRVALGGHSYGAFMTANVLAHSDLFKAGIARSGAYNRSLTPFGFQREERTIWDDPQLYQTMSPFFSAHQINTPLLLIHGSDDNNSGTFPMQSERLYQAVKGLGGTTRLVMLPHESHGYRARESVLHMLWETIEWLDEFVKHAD